jgi:hypothetical protein
MLNAIFEIYKTFSNKYTSKLNADIFKGVIKLMPKTKLSQNM